MVVPSGLADSLNTANVIGLMGAATADLSNPESLFDKKDKKKTKTKSDSSGDGEE